jgi:uncharacterized protein YjbJ (UPF0337 family)
MMPFMVISCVDGDTTRPNVIGSLSRKGRLECASGGTLTCSSRVPRFGCKLGLARMNVRGRMTMDKDRIAGSAKVVAGKVKVAAGKVMGDAKLQADGNAEKAAGKVQNAVGGIKDALKGK